MASPNQQRLTTRRRPPDPARAPWTVGRVLKRLALALVAVSLTAILIGSAFFKPVFAGGFRIEPRFPIGQWFADLPSHLWWVLVFAIFTASMAPLRAWRWGFVLPRPKPHYEDRYHAVAIGLLANNAVPGKLGEAIRSMSLTRFSEQRGRAIPFAQSLGTVLVCKLIDVIALLTLVSLSPSGPFFGATTSLKGGFVGVVIVLPVLIALLFLTARYAPKIADWLHAKGRSPKLENTLRELAVGVAASGSLLHVGKAFGATLIAIGAVATGYTFAMYGVGMEPGVTAGIVMLAAVTLGQSPPGVPAGLGVYYLAATWSARLLGATAEQAATLAVLTHLTTVLTHMSVGGVSLFVRKVRLRDFLPKRKKKQGSDEVVAEGARLPA
ncbi:lysylphosphatidylglycerol synthase transmembrane domain-containing protein [Vulgatibacter sp.]|uniref:lysylphosphatidylglycerol synthase transmembrane domain-containing protein n=1 Tax=Vulgatibacter sp. TaxID=1971226 RepID=UPI0035612F68